MAQYGARVVGYLTGIDPVFMRFTAGGTFAKGDLVMLEGTTGQVILATTGSLILGVARMAGTDGTENIKIDVTPGMKVIMDADDAITATSELQYMDINEGTGAQTADVAKIGATQQQLMLLKANPQGFGCDSDVSMGLYLITERTFGQA